MLYVGLQVDNLGLPMITGGLTRITSELSMITRGLFRTLGRLQVDYKWITLCYLYLFGV